jgi:23S rRNA G2445 N2-methylase RlmL
MTRPLRILAVADPGCEAACATEIAHILKRKPGDIRTRTNIAELDGSWEDAVTLAYRAQTALRVLVAIAPTAKELDTLVTGAPDMQLIAAALPAGGAFKAEGENFDPELMPQELTEGIGAWIHEAGIPVNLSRPDLVIVGVATPDGLDVGIDLAGTALAKREWRVMLSSKSIKGTIAASAAVYAGLQPKHVILDPFGDDGSLAIEATMFLAGVSPRMHARNLSFTRFPVLASIDWPSMKARIDKGTVEGTDITVLSDTMRDMKAVRTNAKLAGVDKFLRSTRISMDWVDAKLAENSIDRILTAPITSGKVISEQRATKIADQLFWQAGFILNKNGTMTCITEKPHELEDAAKTHAFKESVRREVRMGQKPLTIITFIKEKS